jgi:hypothetical protein
MLMPEDFARFAERESIRSFALQNANTQQ